MQFDFSIPQTTHCISVRSMSGRTRDAKSFSISSPKNDIDSMHRLIEKFVKDHLPKKLPNDIVFMGLDQRKFTHTIVITIRGQFKAPSVEGEKLQYSKSKAISIKYPAYSSAEIAKEIQKHLCGGKSDV